MDKIPLKTKIDRAYEAGIADAQITLGKHMLKQGKKLWKEIHEAAKKYNKK